MSPRQFWAELVPLLRQLAAALDHGQAPDHIVGLVDALIERIGYFGWEIGPHAAGFMFALSPGDEPELQAKADAFLAVAPTVSRWHFFSAKPPRVGWVAKFSVRDSDGREYWVDGSAATFCVLDGEPGRLQLTGIDFGSAPVSLRQDAVEILVDGVVGERTRRSFTAIDVVGSSAAGVFRPLHELAAR